MPEPPDLGTTRVWRHLQEDQRQAQTPAQESILRLALGMWAADPRSALTPEQRQRVVDWLQPPEEKADWPVLTPEQRRKVQGPLLRYFQEWRPDSYGIVARQFPEDEPPDEAT